MLWLFLTCAITFVLPFAPGVREQLGSVACEPGETFEWKQTSSGTETSWSWVCVDPLGRFSVSNSSVRAGEVAAMGLSFAVSGLLGAIPFGVARAIRRRR